MPRIEPTAVKLPTFPFAFKAPSFPSLPFPNLNVGRALTGRNLIILTAAAVGIALFMIAFKIRDILHAPASPQAPVLGAPQAAVRLGNSILDGLFKIAKEPNEATLNQVQKDIEVLNELILKVMGSIDSAQNDIKIDPKLLQEADYCDLAIVLQNLETAPKPLSDLVIKKFQERLKTAFSQQFEADRTIDQAKTNLIQAHAFLGLVSSPKSTHQIFNHRNRDVQFDPRTLQILSEAFYSALEKP